MNRMLLFAAGAITLLSACSTPYQPATETLARFDSCLRCHTSGPGPVLNGLQSWYAQSQMLKIQQGIRTAGTETICHNLPEARELRPLARYLASLTPVEHPPTVTGDAGRGETLYAQCATCHGKKAEGSKLLKSPQLRTLEDRYLLEQLTRFKDGSRGAHPDDAQGLKMAESLAGLNEQDFRDLTVYIRERFGTVKTEN